MIKDERPATVPKFFVVPQTARLLKVAGVICVATAMWLVTSEPLSSLSLGRAAFEINTGVIFFGMAEMIVQSARNAFEAGNCRLLLAAMTSRQAPQFPPAKSQ